MALLKNRYKAAASTELERDIRRREEMGASSDKSVTGHDTAALSESDISANITFSQNIALITDDEANSFRARMDAFYYEREARDIDDGYENIRERGKRFRNLDDYHHEIGAMRGSSAHQDPSQAAHSITQGKEAKSSDYVPIR